MQRCVILFTLSAQLAAAFVAPPTALKPIALFRFANIKAKTGDDGKVDRRLDPLVRTKLKKQIRGAGGDQKYSESRRAKLGNAVNEEYDLDAALDANTDDFITKVIAGSLVSHRR